MFEKAVALSWECSGASNCLEDGAGVIVVGVREASGRARKKEEEEGSALTCGPKFVLVVTGELLTAPRLPWGCGFAG